MKQKQEQQELFFSSQRILFFFTHSFIWAFFIITLVISNELKIEVLKQVSIAALIIQIIVLAFSLPIWTSKKK